MITGDHPAATPLAIGRELHFVRDGEPAVSGLEVEARSDADLVAKVDNIAVYARGSSRHKLLWCRPGSPRSGGRDDGRRGQRCPWGQGG